MSTLVLKSLNALDASVEALEFTLYKQRVIADGGFIANEAAVKAAFQYCFDNNLTESEVFSATSANWGVKLEAGKPKKLYTLFGEAGDIDVTIGVPASISYNTTTFNVPVIELKASSTNGLKTKGAANNVRTSGLCIISRAPILNTGAAYGTTGTFALGELSNLSESISAGETLDKRMNSQYYVRTANTELANTWRYLAYGYGTQGNIETTSAELADAAVWNRTTTFLQAGLMQLYKDGALLKQDNTVNEKTWINDLYFNIGRSRNAGITGLDYSSPLYGYVAEAWCLVNTTAEKMRALSSRASQIYATV
ncbi:hypothetical protein AZH09_RS14985 [Acinetobacter baumannii]|uniref:hypothetical protein n=1 Tax=Acinetobacter baumannii TaxID=470 RepID=UPI000A3D31F0|nr:hypothetical protein [Acinetobacter baumannii]EHU1236679.1 hypothetical protein [Acinetobacter baumannii]EHU2204266.1 hypothetical protein [Acinetobacter baumannii]EHU2220460.1 hypothetical protein [Acinetobacter baumannii]EHU2392740.1 hypothetical protein [Acinetobacter baumannii]EHU2599201.1 hypothetical protein [Acinetobacter baumannii]